LLHSLDLGIIIAIRNDVAHGQVLKVNDVVCRDDTEGLLDAEAEGALEPLSHPVTQRSQATDQRVPDWPPSPSAPWHVAMAAWSLCRDAYTAWRASISAV